MTASKLTELAARVEAGSGFDPALDTDISLALGWTRGPISNAYFNWLSPDGKRCQRPALSTSLDAVAALIAERLPGRDWNLIRCSGEFSAWFDSDPERHLGLCLSPPRSLLVATLRALAAQQQDRQTEG